MINGKLHEVLGVESRASFSIEDEVSHHFSKELSFDLLVMETVLLGIATDREDIHHVVSVEVVCAALAIQTEELKFTFIQHKTDSVY